MLRSSNVRKGVVGVVVAAFAGLGLVVAGGQRGAAQVVVPTRAGEVSAANVQGTAVLELPFAAEHVAVHWAGNPDAQVTVAFGGDDATFGPAFAAGRDEVGEQRRNGETYGAILRADGATTVQVTTDRPLGRLSVLGLADGPTTVSRGPSGTPAGASVAQPAIVSRAGWGSDESLRFDANGNETWPPQFWPVQKLVVHHTATQNGDPDPPSTVRAIYYYHSITQGWGDIGYNFLIDEAGNVYKGRHSHTSASSDDTITGEDGAGNGVTAAHAVGYNSGTVGVALLGTLTNQDTTPAARNALADVLAWKADAHGIDPQGSSLYVNPVNGTQQVFANIAGHRDLNATECPGGSFYATLPSLRADVAARIGASTTTTSTSTTTTSTTAADTTPPTAPSGLVATGGRRSITLAWTASSDGGTGVAGYEILRSTKANGKYAVVATSTTTGYTNTGLSARRTYWYRVRAFDGAGNRSSPSITVSATTT